METLHPDPDVSAMLSALRLGKNSFEARAARRLFDAWDELEDFFRSFAANNLLTKEGLLLTSGGVPCSVDVGCVLKSLEEFDTQRDGLAAAAFVCRARHEHSSYSRKKIARKVPDRYLHDLEYARHFVRTLTDVTMPELRLLYSRENENYWTSEKLVAWFRDCMQVGVPVEYVASIHSPEDWVDSWPPETVASLYTQGAPAAYLSRFWRFPQEFAELWSQGIPYEYALASFAPPDGE